MQLRQWIDEGRGTVLEVAARCGVSPSSIYHYMGGSSRPGALVVALIEIATGGEVGLADWLQDEVAQRELARCGQRTGVDLGAQA